MTKSGPFESVRSHVYAHHATTGAESCCWLIVHIGIRHNDIGSGILHLRATLPHIFDSNPPTNLFPPTIYSNSVSLSLPAPLPLKVSRNVHCRNKARFLETLVLSTQCLANLAL